MKTIFDYTAQELFRMLNESSESCQIEAKGNEDILRPGKNGKPGRMNYRTLMETVCSFSNEPGLGGGVILLGIGETKGASPSHFLAEGLKDTDHAQLDIATQCKTVFNIPIYPQIKIETVDGQKVLAIHIQELAARQKPLFFQSDGLPKGAYRRIGSADLRCTEDDLRVFYADSVSGYDQLPVPGAMVEDVDPEAMKRYRILRKQVNPAAEELLFSDQELLESLGCVCADNHQQLNLAGVLLFGSYKLQRRTIPTTRIDYIRVPGNRWIEDPEASFRSIDMLGPLLLTLYRLVDAVNADLPKGFLLREGELQADTTGLPVRVLREAIVNAMMHRSYREDRPTQIIRYDNRIEITNAGFSLKETDELGTPGSKIRNAILAPIFHDVNLAETKGTGIKRMRELMAKAHLAQPTFESSRERNEFTIRLLLHHFLGPEDLEWLTLFHCKKLNDAQKTALIFVRELGAIDNATFRQIGNCDTLRASKALREMREMELLISKGKGSASYYVPGSNFPAQTEIPQAHGGIPQASAEIPQADAEIPQASAEIPQAGAERPQASAEIPQAGTEIPQASAETPQARTEIPQVVVQIPQIGIEDFSHELQQELRALGKRCRRSRLSILTLKLCSQHPLTRQNLAELLHRDESNLKKLILKPLIESQKLRYLIPEMVKHPRQAYITNISLEELERDN